RRRLTLLMLGVGVLSVFVALAQVAQGPGGSLHFYSGNGPSEAVGFFANRNHFAALLYVLILFAAAWSVDRVLAAASGPAQARFRTASVIPIVAGFTVLVALIACAAMARSRAGLGLTILALLGALTLAMRDRRAASGVTPARLLLGATALGVMLFVQF